MDKEQLDNIISMLTSADKENHVLALSIIEETQKEDAPAAMFLAMKLGLATKEQWENDAPKSIKRAKSILGDLWREDMIITFHTIFTIITTTKQKPEQVVLFMQFFTEYLTKQMQQLGYDFIEEISIKVKE